MAEAPTPTMDFNILLFNVEHGDPKKKSTEGIAEDQLSGIRKVLGVISPPNMFVLCQDKISKSKAECLRKKLGYQHIISHKGEKEKDTDIFHDLRHNPTYSGTIIPQSQFEPFIYLHRLTAWRVLMHGQSVLIVSWHGPSTGMKGPPSKRVFKSLLDSVAKVQTESKVEVVVIGGDFNLKMEEAKAAAKEYNVWDKASRNGEIVGLDASSKDFLVMWPKHRVHCVEHFTFDFEFTSNTTRQYLSQFQNNCTIPFPTSQRKCKGVAPFDHKRVLFRLKLIPETSIPFARNPFVGEIAENLRKLSFNKK